MIAQERPDGVAGRSPLAGLKVLDFTHVFAGPFCTRTLADLGADVVHVESPSRDPGDRHRATYAHRNKRSITLDLKSEAGYGIAAQLAAGADVIAENFSAGVMRRLKLDYATLAANNPRSIYIRPFDVTYTDFRGRHHSEGEKPIRRSLIPAEFGEDLKEELEKIAPAMVLKEDEFPRTGWLVEGDFDVVNAGSPIGRALPGNVMGIGSSQVIIHVRVTDLDARRVAVVDAKDKDSADVHHAVQTSHGAIVYEFDVKGGSKATGKFGSITAPGLGYAVPFDFRNAAERIYTALTADPHHYGVRSSPAMN